MGQQKRERKLTGLNTLPAVRRTKGLSKSREELAGCGPAQRYWKQEAGGRGKGQAQATRTASPTALQTGLQFLIKDLLRLWMVDICREGRGETQGACTRPAQGLGLGTRRGEGACTRLAPVETEAGTAEGRRRAAPRESAPVKLLAA